MKLAIASLALCAVSTPVFAHTASVLFDPLAPTSNFDAPTNMSNTTAYDVITSQDDTTLYVDVKVTGDQAANALPFSNIYLGGDTLVGFEVVNNRAFDPNVGTYYDLTGTGFSYHVTGSAATGDLDIGFSLPFSFLENDPLGIGFHKLSADEGNNFTRVSYSQSFGYSVAGGQAFYGNDRLGSFTIPAQDAGAVPEPASWALMITGFGLVGAGLRRRSTRLVQGI